MRFITSFQNSGLDRCIHILSTDACTEIINSLTALCLITMLYSKFINEIYTLIILEGTCKVALATAVKNNPDALDAWK